ncbi:MAG: carbon storage regulator CsrA [Tissierellia bacterium]|nr:carbon storage regulator CsrA [Tissierellia bacterium]
MLILSRKKDESIIIGDNIEVKVLAIEDGRVSIGVDAPRDMDIFRHELYLSIEEQNLEAARLKPDIKKINQFLKTRK